MIVTEQQFLAFLLRRRRQGRAALGYGGKPLYEESTDFGRPLTKGYLKR